MTTDDDPGWEVYDRRRSNIVLGALGGLLLGVATAVVLLAAWWTEVLIAGLAVDALVVIGTVPRADARAGGVTFVVTSVAAFLVLTAVVLVYDVLHLTD